MRQDLALTELVQSVNDGGERIPVVLLVGGALITGMIASAQDYADVYPHLNVSTTPDLDDLGMVHLADAAVNGQATGWWRVALERVDAFSLQSASA